MQSVRQETLQQVPNYPHLPIFHDGLTHNFKVKKLLTFPSFLPTIIAGHLKAHIANPGN